MYPTSDTALSMSSSPESSLYWGSICSSLLINNRKPDKLLVQLQKMNVLHNWLDPLRLHADLHIRHFAVDSTHLIIIRQRELMVKIILMIAVTPLNSDASCFHAYFAIKQRKSPDRASHSVTLLELIFWIPWFGDCRSTKVYYWIRGQCHISYHPAS